MTTRRSKPTTPSTPDADFIITAPKKRRVPLDIGGANRGATAALDGLAEFNATSAGLELVPTYIDPVPGRAASLAMVARDRGIIANHVEGRIEDQPATPDVRVYHLDRPGSIATGIERDIAARRPLLGYLVVLLPSGAVAGVRMAVHDDHDAAREAILLLRGLERVTARRGGRAIFGESGDVRHARLEPLIRGWFAEHSTNWIGKLAAGVEADGFPLEITFDGIETLSLHVVTSDAPSDPNDLAERVLASPNAPVGRGSRFMIVELLPDAVRFHEIRYRTDGRILVRASLGFDQAAADAADGRLITVEDERRQQRESNALGLALINNILTQTATRSNPIAATD